MLHAKFVPFGAAGLEKKSFETFPDISLHITTVCKTISPCGRAIHDPRDFI